MVRFKVFFSSISLIISGRSKITWKLHNIPGVVDGGEECDCGSLARCLETVPCCGLRDGFMPCKIAQQFVGQQCAGAFEEDEMPNSNDTLIPRQYYFHKKTQGIINMKAASSDVERLSKKLLRID